ncbi:MAG: glycoside hydrolase family 31 protein [Desulfovibrionales bacterium]|nr:glycoside hydrolase family 31 protein [Desulfovibrionales bacterium]
MKMRLLWLVSLFFLIVCNPLYAEVKRVKFSADHQYLIVETLDDDLIHFELSAAGSGPVATVPLYTSPMIHKTDYTGPSFYVQDGGLIETAEIRIRVNGQNLCASIEDKIKNRPLTTICPCELDKDWKGLILAKGQIENVYGLGQQFKVLGSADGDWLQHKVREEQPAGQAQSHGNGFMPFGPAGMVGNVQFPVMYAVGSGNLNYALLVDNVYKQRWDFAGDPWRVNMWGDQIRYYVMTGPDLPDLRKDYMELVGTPPVPPRKAFGLWVSEFGYKNWPQIDRLRASLRKDNFPLDGFVLDLQWFGGVIAGSPDSQMGRLDWDRDCNDSNGFCFPDTDANIAFFKNDQIGLTAIEESYVNENTDTFAQMKAAGSYFAYSRTNNQCDPSRHDPVLLTDWFGKAAMIDWSNPDAGIWVHDNRRFPNLVSKGITTHWTDLGEPEKYDGSACYHGVEVTASGPKNQHGDVHNIYAFLWNKSIYDGYYEKREVMNQRPFILSRSGAPGSQRFGVAMWSGDIGSNLELLATHLNAQMHMSFSGIDYYGSDIGGFRREGIPYNGGHSGNLQYQNELYTEWLANGAWFDVPVRPHTDNSFQTSIRYETAPNLVGNAPANLMNIRQRYELIPYYYSLAHRAYLYGEPVIPPLVFYYQNDPNVRQIGHEKLIGRDILVCAVASHGEYMRNVYLPKGKWVNYHTHEWFNSSGQWTDNFPTYIEGVFRLPVFARAGAIIPMMYVDYQTKDAFGRRKDETSRDELIVQVYADATPTGFTLYEDDGSTINYGPDKRPVYKTRNTVISQQKSGSVVTVVIDKASGSYEGAVARRNNVLRLVVEDALATRVTLNRSVLPPRRSAADFNAAASGWYNAARNLILIKSGVRDVYGRKTFKVQSRSLPPVTSVNFVCDNCWTALGEKVYVVGNKPELGNWDPNKAVQLYPSVYYEYIYNPPPGHNGPGPKTPKWTGLVQGLPPNTAIEWKYVKKLNSGEWQFKPGNNDVIAVPKSGFAGTSAGSF